MCPADAFVTPPVGPDRRSATAMQAAVERLQSGLEMLGAPPLQSPASAAALQDVATTVAPWRLPAEVERFWRIVDGDSSSFTRFPHPHAADPGFALECWQEHKQQPGTTPDLLFPVCYESFCFLLVELHGTEPGGACFTWSYDGNPFELVATDLTSYLEVAAETLEAGLLAGGGQAEWRFSCFDADAFREALRRRLRQSPHPRYGAEATFDADAGSWPDHWLESVGPAAEEQHARGATTTIAALAASGPGTAGRVHAEVRELWGSDEGFRVVIDDGTGHLDVWCPSAVTMFGPTCPGRFEFELATADAPHLALAEALAVRRVAQEA